MDHQPIVWIEKWDGPSHSEEQVQLTAAEGVEEVLETLRDCGSGTLSIAVGEKSLIVAASKGRFTACALLGDDGVWDRLSGGSDGTVPFIEGGQSVELPKQHLLSFAQALAAAKEFYRTGTVGIGEGWERQC